MNHALGTLAHTILSGSSESGRKVFFVLTIFIFKLIVVSIHESINQFSHSQIHRRTAILLAIEWISLNLTIYSGLKMIEKRNEMRYNNRKEHTQLPEYISLIR